MYDCNFSKYEAKQFIESIRENRNYEFLSKAERHFDSILERINSYADNAFKLGKEALDSCQYASKKICEKKDALKRKKNKLASTPAIVYQDTGKKDQYGNPIRKVIDNNAIRSQYLDEIAKLEDEIKYYEEKYSMCQGIIEWSESVWHECSAESSKIQSNIDSLRGEYKNLEEELMEIQKKAEKAYSIACDIYNHKVKYNPDYVIQYIDKIK